MIFEEFDFQKKVFSLTKLTLSNVNPVVRPVATGVPGSAKGAKGCCAED